MLCQCFDTIWKTSIIPKPLSALRISMESCVMHQLRFKGPGFDFDAKGWVGILAAIAIIALILVLPRFW